MKTKEKKEKKKKIKEEKIEKVDEIEETKEEEQEVKQTRSSRRKSKHKLAWNIVLYSITALHLILLVLYFFDKKHLIGFNFIFPVPNVILTAMKDKWLLFALNLIMFAVGLVLIIFRVDSILIK